jgi:hypothetical protein
VSDVLAPIHSPQLGTCPDDAKVVQQAQVEGKVQEMKFKCTILLMESMLADMQSALPSDQ